MGSATQQVRPADQVLGVGGRQTIGCFRVDYNKAPNAPPSLGVGHHPIKVAVVVDGVVTPAEQDFYFTGQIDCRR
jgi:hypothetical protein